MSASDRHPARTSALLGDLETLRALLDGTARDAPSDPASRPEEPDDEVPLLEDVVGANAGVSDPMLSAADVFGDDEPTDATDAGLDADLFETLLGDEWRSSAGEIVDAARSTVEQHRDGWTAEHTDRLSAALEARLEETLHEWLRTTVMSRLDELREELLVAAKAQIRDIANDYLADQQAQANREGPHAE